MPRIQGGDSIDIWTALTWALSRALTILAGKRLPKRVLNLVLNPSLKFLVSIELHPCAIEAEDMKLILLKFLKDEVRNLNQPSEVFVMFTFYEAE